VPVCHEQTGKGLAGQNLFSSYQFYSTRGSYQSPASRVEIKNAWILNSIP